MRKFLTTLIVILLGLILVVFAVANRHFVTVSLDPFNSANPSISVSLPLFVLIFALVILGVIVGSVATWFRQASWRRTARALDADVRILHQELEGMRRRADAQDVRYEQAQESRALTVSSAGR